MGIKEVSIKNLDYAIATPRTPDEEANMLSKIVREFGKARTKAQGLGSWINPQLGDVKLIELHRKGGKPSSKAPVVFAMVLDSNGLRLEAQTAGIDTPCSSVAPIPGSVSDQREFLKDLNRADNELVTDDELAKFNRNNPTTELKGLYAQKDSADYKFTSFVKMKGDSLKLFRTWADKNDKNAFKDMEYLRTHPGTPPPAVLKRIDAALQTYNGKMKSDIDAKIKKAEAEI